MNINFSRSLGALLIVGALGVGFVAGAQYGYDHGSAIKEVKAVTNKENTVSDQVDFSPFWEVWTELDQKFVGGANGTTTKIATDQDRVWGAISGMVASVGDPYTVFMPPVEKKKFEEEIAGNFGGVGMELGMKEGKITVVAPLPNSPAKKAGIKSGDKVVKVDDKDISGLAIDEVISKIRGKEGTVVKLTISRAGEKELKDFTLIRDIIQIPTIATKKLPDGVFVISLYNFSAQSPNLFRNSLREFVESKSDKLIIDLRGNPGGYMEAAIDMASWFLPADKVIVRETRKTDAEKTYRSHGYNIFTDRLKMVVLIDQGSASAAEILAGALKEQGKAILVGEKSFGKGSVQELIPVGGDASLKVTIARWLTPSGHSLSSNGLDPDYKVSMTKEDLEANRDVQMAKAIEILTGKVLASSTIPKIK
jgi:carboxyl-terminal processing protease